MDNMVCNQLNDRDILISNLCKLHVWLFVFILFDFNSISFDIEQFILCDVLSVYSYIEYYFIEI